MPYIGNTIRAADDYRLIDDISSSFNGSTTSFALQVAGSAPVPFPKSPQQVLISVNGVIQEPDPTGASGFNLVGTNIVFSSAPTNGHAFFGIIYATADYLNAGGNFPSGSLGAPSFTFIGDENTGLYRKSGGSVGFVSDATEIANFDSNGITISSGNLILGDSSGANDDRIKLGASGDLEIYHDGSHSYIQDSGTGELRLRGTTIRLTDHDGTENFANFVDDGAVELFHNNSKKFETASNGAIVTGSLGVDELYMGDNEQIKIGAEDDFLIYHGGSENVLDGVNHKIELRHGSEKHLVANPDGKVEIYYDNTKTFETKNNGIIVLGGENNNAEIEFHADEGDDNADKWRLKADTNGQFEINNFASGSYERSIECNANGNVELYFNNAKQLETFVNGVQLGNVTKTLLWPFDGSTNSRSWGWRGENGSYGIFELDHSDGNDTTLDKTSIRAVANGQVMLYHNDVVKLETTNGGISVTGGVTCDGITLGDNEIIQLGNSNDLRIYHDSGANYVGTFTAQSLVFFTNNNSRWFIDATGHFLPITDNTFDLGSPTKRVRNLYTTDLKLSNEGSQNDVDATWGNYTIQEGHEDLFLINHRTGKKFKFNLTEVA